MTDASNPASYVAKRETFGAWLFAQRDRGDWVDALATAARADRGFPRTGDVEAVRKWLSGQRASGDDWEALEDAVNSWDNLG